MNIKNTLHLLALCVSSLVSGMAYGQRITNKWVYEEWTTGTNEWGYKYPTYQFIHTPKATDNWYLMKPADGGKDGNFGKDVFLKYESDATVEPYDATLFTFSDEDVDREGGNNRWWYKISCHNGSRIVYVYTSNGNAKWGDENENRWCVETTNSSKKQYILWQNDPDDSIDPRLMAIQKNGTDYAVSYLERKILQANPSENDWVFISEAQYNALYPENLVRKSLGYNKIKCLGVYYPQGYNDKLYKMKSVYNNIQAYKTPNGTWLARTIAEPAETKSHGARIAACIEGLVPNYSYNFTVYAHVSRPVEGVKTEGDAWDEVLTEKNILTTPAHITAKGSNEVTKNVKGTYGVNCPDLEEIKLEGITPDAEGRIVIYITTESNVTNYVYTAIKSVEHETILATTGSIDTSQKYYLYNMEADQYLDAGGTNGNSAVLGHGLDLNLENVESPQFRVNTSFSGDPTNNYFNGTMVNGAAANITFTQKDDHFRLKTGGNFIYADGTTITTSSSQGSNAYGKWQLISYDQRKLELHRATVDNPKDATFLIKQPAFSKYNCSFRPYSAWDGFDSEYMKQDGGEVDGGKNCNLKITSPSFNISQTLTDIPNGLYLVSAQGAHNDPNYLHPIVELYAEDICATPTTIVSPFTNLTGSSQLTDGVVAARNFDSGMYKTSLLVIVTDHKLRVGARSFAKDGITGVDNFELTYYGKYNIDDMDVTTLFIKNPHFQGSSSSTNWRDGWTVENYDRNLGNNNMSATNGNTYQGYGYFADCKGTNDISTTIDKGSIYQKIYLPAGAYKLSALCAAQNNPGYLFVKDGDYNPYYSEDMGQHIVFVDNKDASKRQVTPSTRELVFVVPESGYFTVGYRHAAVSGSTWKVWNAVDNFRLEYLGYAAGTEITCQVVNPGLDADNKGLSTSKFGWTAETGSTGFTYGNDCGERFYTQTANNLFNTFQTVKGLPDGWYEVGVQGFYRDGWGQAATANRKNVFLYANKTYEHIGMIDGDDRFTPDTEKYGTNDGGYPNSMAGAQTAFKAGYYPNKVIARVTDGNLKIGVNKETAVEWDWAIFDNFKLTYLYSDANIQEGTELTQFIKNPSFETGNTNAWEISKNASVKDNKSKDLMTNGDARYLLDAGSQSKLDYYHIKQTISGTENGLPQGQYVLKAKLSSVEDNDIAVFVNGRLGSFITNGTNEGREIELGSIGINNNEMFDISFTSNYGFKIDNLRLIRSSREGEGDALIVDLDGLIAQAKAILESGFVGDGAFQINGDELKKAYDKAVEVNSNPTEAYSNKKDAKDKLVAQINAIQTATPKKPDADTNYMIKHMASGYYLATDGKDVIIKNEPSTIQFHDEDLNSKYQLYDPNNGANKYIYKHDTSEGAILNADPDNKTEISFRIIFINGIPSHIALTHSNFEDGTCLGTESTNYNSKVFCTTDATDGYSRWMISVYDPTIKNGDKMYLYNLEAGAFIETTTPAPDQLDGVVAVITDASGTNTLAVSHTDHPNGEQDVFSTPLASVTEDKYIYAKFAKVTDASVSGDNLYTIQMHNADGESYNLWGNNGYLNFQPAGQNIVFALGLGEHYGQDAENCALWRVTYESGKGYVIQNVGNGGYYDPNNAAPSAEPVSLVLEKAPTTLGNNAIQWNVVVDDNKYKLNYSSNKYLNVSNTGHIGIHSFITQDDKDNKFVFVPAGDGYDYNIYTISMDPSNSTFGTSTYGNTYLGWSGESNYKPILPLISKDDAEPRGIHWMKCSREEYNTYKVSVAKAHDARMNAWPVIRSAIRNGVDMTEFNRTYNNPMALPGEITNAAIELKSKVMKEMLVAIPSNPKDVSYDIKDAECQSLTVTEGGWTGSGFVRHGNKPLFENIGGKQKMILGGYSYKSTTGNPASMSKQITGLIPGKYALALDINATTSGGTANGLKLYINNGSNEKRADISGITTTTSTIVTPEIEVGEGETVTIGFEIESSNNITSVAFDNFKLRLCDPYREIEKSTVDNVTTLQFKGYWRGTENSEASKAINDQRVATSGNDLATTAVNMESATIVNDMDLTFTNPKAPSEKQAGNVLVWTPANAPVTINGVDQNVIKDGNCTSFVITDGQTLNIPKAFNANNVKYVRNMKNSYATILLPYDIETSDEVQLYTLHNAGKNKAGEYDGSFNIERVNNLTAGTPGFMRKKNASAESISFIKTDGNYAVSTTTGDHIFESTDEEDDFKVIGSYTYGAIVGDNTKKEGDPNWGKAGNKKYYIKNNQFYEGYNYFYNDAFRAYIDGTEAPESSAREIFSLIEWEMPDGIEDEVNEMEGEIIGIFTTNGTQIDDIKPGVNIIKYSNGQVRKVFVK